MKRILKTTIVSALVLSMALSGATAAVAATPAAEENCISASAVADWAENVKIKLFNKSVYAKYAPGVTVEKDENSPTGYTVTFVYKEQKSYTSKAGLTINTAENPLTKVELYSDCFMLFDPAGGKAGAIDASLATAPYNYTAGLAPAGGNGDTTYYVELEKFADGRWGVQMPLSSGAFVYNFRVTAANGDQIARLDDPINPTITNSATGIHSLSSMVYVPYDADKQGTSTWADRSVELPQANANKRGTVQTVSYTGADGTEHGLAVYLPAGYDADRTEPYKVLYLSHGNSGDTYGNELRWMNEGTVANILDNLIAECKTEPFIVVTMNNQQYKWKYSEIETDQINYIMPYVESHYNVSTTAEGRAYAGLSIKMCCSAIAMRKAEGRAYAGLSMGGATTSNMLMHHTELFSYYGIWSYANVNGAVGGAEGITSQSVRNHLSSLTVKPKVMLAAGNWDFGLAPVKTFGENLSELGLDYSYLQVPAAHDWECWQLIFANAAENFLWK